MNFEKSAGDLLVVMAILGPEMSKTLNDLSNICF